MLSTDTDNEENSEQQNDENSHDSGKKKFISKRMLQYMIAAGTIIVIAVSVLVYNLPAKKEPVVHRSQIKKQETAHNKAMYKVMTSSHQDSAKEPKAEQASTSHQVVVQESKAEQAPAHQGVVAKESKATQEHHFTNATTAKTGRMPSHAVAATKQDVNRENLRYKATLKKRRVLSNYMKKKLNPRNLVRRTREEALHLPTILAIPQKPTVSDAPQPTKSDPYVTARIQKNENISLFIAKGWTPYYTRNSDVLLYRNVDGDDNISGKLLNTAWFLGTGDIVVFAHALNCSDKSMDTFAFSVLNAKTLRTISSKSRDITENGMQFKYIQDTSDLALYDRACR